MINSFDDLYTLMVDETNKDYISDYKDSILNLLNKEETKNKIKIQLKNNHYSSLAIVDLFLPVLNDYDNKTSSDWLKYIFNFTLSLSYPEKITQNFDVKLKPLLFYYLNTLRIFTKLQIKNDKDSFLHQYPISFLSEEEKNGVSSEYFKFLDAYSNCYVYELMYMDMDITGHNTLEHLVGVNHLSIFISRQLKSLGLPIDLGTIVGASLAHDIGKYGVLDIHKNKVPYYHYYYSDEWYKKHDMPHIGHIASNHSTWDLELENLPLESLILIYSDFRIKNKIVDKTYIMNVFSLESSYDIILNKLDNLDEAKEQRYEKVYKKLRDFEEYIHDLGVNTNPHTSLNPFRKTYHKVFMNSKEIVSSFKFLAIENNIYLMNKLIDDNDFNNILELVRSEYNWRKLRVYLQIFSEYSTYITKKQKKLLINFLLDLLFHKEEDIRKESALLIGILISDYDEDFRKENPPSVIIKTDTDTSKNLLDDILNKFLFPDYKYANSNVNWQYNLKSLIKSVFINSNNNNSKEYIDILLEYYKDANKISEQAQLYLAQTSKYIPYNLVTDNQKAELYEYIESLIYNQSSEIRLTILDIIDEIYENSLKNKDFDKILINWLNSKSIYKEKQAEIYLKYKLSIKLNLDSSTIKNFKDEHKFSKDNISDIFLKNLKTATNWMSKKINIDILYDQVLENPRAIGLHTGMHFCNLLKVSAVEKVRNYAGHTLINIFPYLSIEEKNDIVVELLRALEMQNYQFTKYIPKYLGRAILKLEASELNEIIDDLEIKIKTSNIQTSFLILQLIGYSIEYISEYEERDKLVFEKTLNRLIGILLIGMASYEEDIKMESLRILSTSIFNSKKLVIEDKYYIFNIVAKKLLILLPKNDTGNFLLLNNSSSFNHIYRFIIDYEFEYGDLDLDTKTKYAFFPGSFDPFTSGHKEIVRTIRDLGFEVYLAIDEFSWSKRTQAHIFRKDIINMSLANERDIFIFPGDIPINISNDKDLKKLESLFDSSPFIVVGVDVLLNASAYSRDNYITKFPHIVIDREDEKENLLKEKLKLLTNETLFLNIDKEFRDISSTKIRNRIDLERDISDKIDPLAEDYIYEHGLYIREPEYKTTIESKTIEYKVFSKKDIDKMTIMEIKEFLREEEVDFLSFMEKKDSKLLVFRNSLSNKILGVSIFYKMNSQYFLDEFNDMDVTEYLRNKIKGTNLFIPYIYSPKNFNTLLNETLLYAIKKGYNHSIINLNLNKEVDFPRESIISHGFLAIPKMNNLSFLVDMNNPISFSENIEIFLKPPFDRDLTIKNRIEKSRIDVKKSINNLFPGELILSISRDMIYSKMIDQICEFNKVPSHQEEKRVLGKHLCVPFGDILNDTIIPNTVTKTLHTEKVFDKNLRHFTIDSFPNYLSLLNQVKVLKSFNRPVILVDDILNKGHRLNSISPYLKSEKLNIEIVIAGILSGKGLEIAKNSGITVKSAYFIPNLKLWFNESSLVPFLGGDMVDVKRDNHLLIPSVNFILPYANPRFIDGNKKHIHLFSKTVLENSILLFEIIEKVYQEKYKKNLLIRNLGEVLTIPRKPDIYNILDYSASTKPSEYLKEDLNQLNRIY